MRLLIVLLCGALVGCATPPTPAQIAQQARIDECTRAVGLVEGRVTASRDGRWIGNVPTTHIVPFVECLDRRGGRPWSDVMVGGG